MKQSVVWVGLAVLISVLVGYYAGKEVQNKYTNTKVATIWAKCLFEGNTPQSCGAIFVDNWLNEDWEA